MPRIQLIYRNFVVPNVKDGLGLRCRPVPGPFATGTRQRDPYPGFKPQRRPRTGGRR
jgi:hypothetical protein